MKTKIYTLLFLLISFSFYRAVSQTALPSRVNADEKKITSVKSFESRYINGKVYLHVTVNGNTETKIVAIERSLDATNYEVIGYMKIYGTNVLSDLAYYFTDELPVAANLYYRLSDYSVFNEPGYSEIISVIPVDESKTPYTIMSTASFSGEQQSFVPDWKIY
ncbi:MAG: hypothetical protein V1904_04015 [Bacteroidota bacterium]